MTWACSSDGLSGTDHSGGSSSGRSASSIAEAITCATGIVPASPTPLMPSGLSGDGVSWCRISMFGISVAYGMRKSMNPALRSDPSSS